MELVVMIEENDDVAFSFGKCPVSGSCCTAVGLTEQFQTRLVLLNDFNCCIHRTVVDDNELGLGPASLFKNGFDRVGHESLCIEGGHKNGVTRQIVYVSASGCLRSGVWRSTVATTSAI